ncbi:MAG TPA: ABC transporter permease [Chthoniobacterales bacterium]|nr:ABC transporter permease [Chthoniobacterales bacterium]
MSPLRQTIRLLLKSPGFTITAILILGFGIGANTAIFSLINTALLRPLPYSHPERLVAITMPYQNEARTSFDYPDYLDIAAVQTSFASIAVEQRSALDLTGDGETQRLWVNFASPSLFTVTGRTAILGRVFKLQEDVPHGPLLAVISERLWRNHFNADPNVIGKKLTLSEQSFEIIGVVPAQMDMGTFPTDVYLPVNTIALFSYPIYQRVYHIFSCFGRLKEGVTVAQAQAELEVVYNGLIDRYPDVDKGYGIRISPLLKDVISGYSGTVWLLGAAVAVLLLIAAANVANLVFVRGLERRRELAIRAAIGATRSRLISQMLLETGMLSFLGGLAGLGLAFGSIELIKKLSPPEIYRIQEVQVDLPALLFVVGIIVLVAFISGVVPAFSLSKPKLGLVLKQEGGRGGTGGVEKYRAQTILVAAQVALACILMTGAGLLVRSFDAAQRVPLGFNPHQILTAQLFLTSSTYEADGVKTRAFWDAVLAKVRQLPGVTEAAMNDSLPLYYDWERLSRFTIDGQPDPGIGHHPVLDWQMISPNYFRTLEIPLLQGRDFKEEDRVEGQQVVIIDDAMAQHYFNGLNPVGKVINLESEEGPRHCMIVGVVPHVRFRSPGTPENQFEAYFPYSQWDYDSELMLVRCQGDPNAQISAVRKAVQSVDPDVPVPDIKTFDDLIAQKLVTRKLASTLVSLFSGAALCLSAIGLYGVLAYSVSQRRREIGVRIALGAESHKILQLVAQQGFKLIGIGLVAGTVVALVCSHFIEGMLYGVTAIDPVSMLIAALVLCLAGCLACLLPALRAVRINPVKALRE